MKKKLISLISLTLLGSQLFAQTYTVSGYILDKFSYEVLISATCFETSLKKGTTSNSSGYYSITLPAGNISLQSSYVGYNSCKLEFNLTKDTVINFLLTSVQLNEVVVVGKSESNFKRSNTGLNIVPVKTLSSIPSFLGEPDLIKAITFLPGVSEGREGISDFYVRGGDRGQNLILLDGAKIYNSNHLGGFISLFNTDVIKSVDLYKGGFPARFGGRASSVLDIHTRDGNKLENHSKFKIGILQSSLLLEGPVKNQNTSYLIAARGSYLDLLTLPIRIKNQLKGTGNLAGYTFLDLNLKINHKINNRNKIFANFYSGLDFQSSYEKDKIEALSDRLIIQTTLLTIGHTIIPTAKTFIRSSIAICEYGNKLSSAYSNNTYLDKIYSKSSSRSTIKELSFKTILDWNPNNSHSIKTGIEISKYFFSPGQVRTISSDSLLRTEIDTLTGYVGLIRSLECAVFVEDDIKISETINLYTGFRAVNYFYKQSQFFNIEPRISLRVLLSGNLSAKINYTRMIQFNHALVSNYQGFEREVWIAATDSIPPQKADQYSLGVYGEISKLNLEYSIEGYYKKMYDLISYRASTSVFDDFSDLQKLLVKGGKGWSYGIEFLIQREKPPVSSTLSYTLSWNYRQFEALNKGLKFPFRFDRRHDLSLITRFKMSKYYTLSSNFTLSTGTPFTLPESYSKDNRFTYGYFIYSSIHNRRLPLYHRLDIGIEKTGKTEKGNTKTLFVNIFNLYAHQNPVYVYYNPYNGKTYKKSLFSIVPSISYSIEF